MFQKLPAGLGKALSGVRAGVDKLLLNEEAAAAPETIQVESTSFTDGGAIPVRHTADGTGTSPALSWSNLPPETVQVLIVVEDPDIPAPQPLIHLIAVVDAATTSVPEGGFGQGELHRPPRQAFHGRRRLAAQRPAAGARPAPLFVSGLRPGPRHRLG